MHEDVETLQDRLIGCVSGTNYLFGDDEQDGSAIWVLLTFAARRMRVQELGAELNPPRLCGNAHFKRVDAAKGLLSMIKEGREPV